jgi:hypothetical protein
VSCTTVFSAKVGKALSYLKSLAHQKTTGFLATFSHTLALPLLLYIFVLFFLLFFFAVFAVCP